MRAVPFVLLAFFLAGLASPATAEDYRVGNLQISQPWARGTPGSARTAAAYMSISIHGDRTDRLVSVSTPVSRTAQLHAHLMENDVMKMRRVAAIEIHSGEPSVLRPGGTHVMLMGLKRPLKEGDAFPMTLTFERAGDVQVMVAVRKMGSMGPHERWRHDGGHGGMKHGS